MATVQSTYNDARGKGFAGMVANGETSNRITRTVETSGGIAFGKPVYRGTGDYGVVTTPNASIQNQLGITIADKASPVTAANASTPDKYPQYANAAIMNAGVIWVLAADDVIDGAQVYDNGSGGFTDTSTGGTILNGWFFQDTVSSGELVRIARRP